MTGNGGHGGADQEKTGRFVFEYELGEYFCLNSRKGVGIMGSATHSIGQLLCMNLLKSVQFFSCLFLAIFINPTALSDLFQVLLLLFSPVKGTFIHEARVDAELCCFL